MGVSLCFCIGNVQGLIERLSMTNQEVRVTDWKDGIGSDGGKNGTASAPLVAFLLITKSLGWRDGSGARSTCCAYRGPKLSSQHPQLLATAALGNLTSFSDLYWHPHIHVCILTHNIQTYT